jgi:hypothetical protein
MSQYQSEQISIEDIKPHPRNYREHSDDQLEHLISSIEQHGFYRNIVISKDNFILAGHGVVQASRRMGLEQLPVVRIGANHDEPQAIKVLTGDNEIGRLAGVDDRMLSELLKEVKEYDTVGLMGTGYDGMMLANLVMVTRPSGEIKDINEAAEWVGMPDYTPKDEEIKVIVSFRNEADRLDFVQSTGLDEGKEGSKTWSSWYPPKEMEDLKSVKYD